MSKCETGHITDREGQCRECGKIVGSFDLMAAGRHLRGGKGAGWPKGSFLALRDGRVMRHDAPDEWFIVDKLTVAEAFGLWELAE